MRGRGQLLSHLATRPLLLICGVSLLVVVFCRCRESIRAIDQSEFDGFEYVNPLLIKTAEAV